MEGSITEWVIAHRFSDNRFEGTVLAQHVTGAGAAVEQFFIGALKNNLSAVRSRPWSHVNDIVGQTYHLFVVLHQQDGVAMVAQALNRMFHQFDIVVVKTCTGFVEYVEHITQR